MFALHGFRLTQQQGDLALDDCTSSSKAALDTVTHMMVDVATLHKDNVNAGNIATLPPTCIYTLHASLIHIGRSSGDYDSQKDSSVEALQGLLQSFTQRWNND